MDVFKLLSRSAKPTASSRPAQNLPSSGAVANPQLFGHDKKPAQQQPTPGSKSSRKRKRGQNTAAEETAPALPAELDFFGKDAGEGKKSKKSRKNGDADGQGDVSKAAQEGASAEAGDEEEPYDEDECKRVLRSHKLKIVVLEDFASAAPEPGTTEKREKKKSKKARKLEEEKAKEKAKHDKKHKKQLWPRPLSSFAELRTRYGISRRLAANIEEQGYKTPTEVQLGTLPLLLAKEGNKAGQEDASGEYLGGDIDLLTVAPTGSGKTIAFTIPIINGLLADAHRAGEKPAEGIRAVILAPTRELASQIVNEARKLAKGTAIKATLMKKGMEVVERPEEDDAEDEEDALEVSDEEKQDSEASDSESDGGVKLSQPKRKRRRAAVTKAAILVATPLALLNALKRKDGTVIPLSSVNYLVLDEADILLDPLFREQTLAIWNACTSPLLRVGLWSATMGSNIESLAIDTMNARWQSLSPSEVSRPPLVRAVVGLKDTAIPNITHKLIYAATEQGKLLGLRQLLHPTAVPSFDTSPSLRPPFLVFTQTIPRAIALHSELLYDIPPEAGGSSRIAVLHANLSTAARGDVMTRFRKGEVWVLITTDLLARGVDFRGLNGVVNYDVPNSAAAYVHRVGRTGRAGREGGVAVTFYTQEDIPYVKNVANVIHASEKLRGTGGEETVKQWLLDALPTPSKRDKQTLKKRGVEARRTVGGKDEEGRAKARISTKSGWERKKENNIREAKRARREGGGGSREMHRSRKAVEEGSGGESEFEGFE